MTKNPKKKNTNFGFGGGGAEGGPTHEIYTPQHLGLPPPPELCFFVWVEMLKDFSGNFPLR